MPLLTFRVPPRGFVSFVMCQLLSVENKKGETIARLAKQMEEDGVTPNVDTYNLMIYG